MKRTILLLSVVILLGLTGCARTIGMLSGNDPDGDGDSKGAASFELKRPATGQRVFIYDPQIHAWAVYDEHGNRVNTGKASGGADYCPDVKRPCRTIVGRFRVILKKGKDCISRKYPIEEGGGGRMPYCMFFSPKGYSVHGYDDIPDYNASHGCIRVTIPAAEWLSDRFLNIGSTVIIRPY